MHDRHIETLPSVKKKMDISIANKRNTNLQAKWLMISMVSEEIRIRIISRPEFQQGITATHILESQRQA